GRYNPLEAIEVTKQLLDENPADKNARLWLSILGLRFQKPELICHDVSQLPSAIDADPKPAGRWITAVLAESGHVEDAIRWAYTSLCYHFGDPHAHITFIGTFIQFSDAAKS